MACYILTLKETYGCGCQHDCSYCYSKSLLYFRGWWNSDEPGIADIAKVQRKIAKLPKDTVVRLGGMTDCFQPLENQHQVTYEAIKALNSQGIEYLVVTKSDLIASNRYLQVLDKRLAHIQITVTCLDDSKALSVERATPPSRRIKAILLLQELGYDVCLRLSPLIREYMDFEQLNALPVNKCLVEFLRINPWIRKWLTGVDFSKYTYWQSNYYHLPLEDKIRLLNQIRFPNITVCEDVTGHYEYWNHHINPNPYDCCNLRR